MWGELAPPTAPQERLCHGNREPIGVAKHRLLNERLTGGGGRRVSFAIAAGNANMGETNQHTGAGGAIDDVRGVAAGR
jgi:hypothetical protein